MKIDQFHDVHCCGLSDDTKLAVERQLLRCLSIRYVNQPESSPNEVCRALYLELKEKYPQELDEEPPTKWESGYISLYPIASMLTTAPVVGFEKQTLLMKAMVFDAAMTNLEVQGGHLHSSVKTALRTIRCLHKDNHLNVCQYLPLSGDSMVSYLETLLMNIEALKQREGQTNKPSFTQIKLRNLVVVLENALQHRAGKTHGWSRGKGKTKLQDAITEEFVDDEPEKAMFYRVVTQAPQIAHGGDDVDIEETEPPFHLAKVEQALNDGCAVDLVKPQSKDIRGHIAKAQMRLTTDSTLLTEFQLGEFLAQCLGSKHVLDEILILVLTTGMLPNSTLSCHDIEDTVVGIDISHRVPAQKSKAKNDTLLKPVVTDVVIPVTKVSQVAYQRFHKTSESELNQHLREHYSSIGATHITINKLANVMASYVSRFGKSKPLREVLTHGNLSKQVALYYLYIELSELLVFQQAYIDWLNELTKSSAIQLTAPPLEQGALGSPLYIDKEPIKHWVEEALRMIDSSSKDSREQTLIGRHNCITQLIHLVLSLSTGHRPSADGFGGLADYCLHTGRHFISDKNSRSAKGQWRMSRTVTLPSIALSLLNRYVAHLKSLSAAMSIYIPIRTHVQAVLLGQSSLLFYLEENDDGLNANSEAIFKAFQTVLSLQANWQRHFLRSYLQQCELPESVIEAFMGHNALFQLTKNRFSALSMQDEVALASHLNELLDALGVKPWK